MPTNRAGLQTIKGLPYDEDVSLELPKFRAGDKSNLRKRDLLRVVVVFLIVSGANQKKKCTESDPKQDKGKV